MLQEEVKSKTDSLEITEEELLKDFKENLKGSENKLNDALKNLKTSKIT